MPTRHAVVVLALFACRSASLAQGHGSLAESEAESRGAALSAAMADLARLGATSNDGAPADASAPPGELEELANETTAALRRIGRLTSIGFSVGRSPYDWWEEKRKEDGDYYLMNRLDSTVARALSVGIEHIRRGRLTDASREVSEIHLSPTLSPRMYRWQDHPPLGTRLYRWKDVQDILQPVLAHLSGARARLEPPPKAAPAPAREAEPVEARAREVGESPADATATRPPAPPAAPPAQSPEKKLTRAEIDEQWRQFWASMGYPPPGERSRSAMDEARSMREAVSPTTDRRGSGGGFLQGYLEWSLGTKSRNDELRREAEAIRRSIEGY